MKFFKVLFLFFISFQLGQAQVQVKMLDSLFNTMHEQDQFSGNVLVVSGGELIYQKSFGLANRVSNTELNNQSMFNIGSVSKPITAVAILQLNEKGLLDVDELVHKYLPKFPYKSITIGHLLTHASGLPPKSELLDAMSDVKMPTSSEVLEFLIKEKPELLFEPGSNSLFNDVGYVVLAEVVEKLSKQSFGDYLKENIFIPAGMMHTGIYNIQQIVEVNIAAKGYLFSPFNQKYEEAVYYPEVGNLAQQSGTEGDANIWSTTGDLLSFCKALANSTLLQEETVLKMFLKKTEAKMPGQTRSYGNSFSYGWTIPEAPYRIAESRGDLPGFNSNIVWNLSENRMIIYLSNNYLSFTSYNNMIPYSVGAIITQNTLNIPKKWASVELTNNVLHIDQHEIKKLINKLKKDTVEYDFDVPGINYLVDRLRDMGEVEKADLIAGLIAEGQ